MRAAPPVSLSCRGGQGWRAVQALLPAVAAAASAAWAGGWLEIDPAAALAAASLAALAAAIPAWRASKAHAVVLAWDGERWSADGHPGELDVMIDLGSWLLLRLRSRLRGAAPARWIAVAAGDAGAAMHALRCAVHARTPTARP